MTLTELKYVIAVAQTRHFGRAAELCKVSQPSLSVAVKKFEKELGVQIFERRSTEATLTAIGSVVVEQAQRVLESAQRVYECAQQGKDPLNGPLRLGVIYTIAPFLLPPLVAHIRKSAPEMPLILAEDYTANLVQRLRNGQIDCAIVALPMELSGLMMQPLYEEDFVVAIPRNHPLAQKEFIVREDLKEEPMLLLGAGHCFRDQILNFCGDMVRTADRNGHPSVEGSSLQTIEQMVAQGLGITILPASSVPYYQSDSLITIRPFEKSQIPKRRVALIWRKSFPRNEALQVLSRVTEKLTLNGCRMLTGLPAIPA